MAAFSAGVVEVIQPVLPGAGDRVLQRLRVPELPERMARILAEILAEDIDKWPRDKWLVVDDYHLVTESTAVEEFVDWLLTLSPIRLIATSRARPVWASARRMLYGEITEITREQLAMTPEEANHVISDVPRRAARPLVDEAKGWPAVIGLAASGASVGAPTAQLSESLYRYMAEELLNRESDEAQDILLRSSVPPSLDPAYAVALGIDLDLFSEVLDRQVLVSRGESSALVLHPLLREFLRRELAHRDPGTFVASHEAALRVAIDTETWHEAFELAQYVGEHESVDVIVLAAQTYFSQGRLETLEKWLAAHEAAAVDSPSASLVRAELLIRLGRLAEAHALAAEVGSTVDDQHPAAAKAWMLRGQASYWHARDTQVLTEQRRAVRLAKSDEVRRQALWYAYLAAQSLGRVDAVEYLDSLDSLNRATPNPADRLRVAVGRVIVRSRQGTLAGCAEILERASSALAKESDPLVVSSFLAHASYVALLGGTYGRAQQLAREASIHARTLRLTFPLHACLGYEALAELGARRFGAAERIYTDLRKLSTSVKDPNLSVITAIVGLKADLMKNREPREGIELPDSAMSCQSSAASEFDALAALAAVFQEDHETARQKLVKTDGASGIEPIIYRIFTRLVLADQAEDPRVSSLLQEALTEAERRGCLDAFVLTYRGYPRILEHLGSLPPQLRELSRRILESANDEKLATVHGFRLSKTNPVETLLTRRELQVIRLMADGLTNAQIAEALVISHSTAKVHVHNIAQKLGAKTRLQAVRRFESNSADLDEG